MTARARAAALALVNWKGVFYERYLLDRHVTALEGSNGAGKTTVMIGAYVVLLPDLSRLRFTNLGETGATGGDRGIWGRLGEASRPSYAALEFELPSGEHLLAGVHLERKAEPSLELRPFLVTGIDLSGRLREVLLKSDEDHDEVPTLDQLAESVRALGGKIELCASAKEYFAGLFDRGVTPLRLGTDEERNKLNEMLRTSMTGGISRALTSELRNFLLKEETGLSSTLSRMRQNLEACHRTRIEVGEAQRLEHEINGVFEAGQAMFATAAWASQKAVEEVARAERQAVLRVEEPSRALRNIELSVEEARARRGTIEQRVAEARSSHERATARRDRIRRARALSEELSRLSSELAAAEQKQSRARAAHQDESAGRQARKSARDQARTAYDRAAHGLAHLQSGLSELHRNAHAHRQLQECLADACRALAVAELDPQHADSELSRVRSELTRLDAERAREHSHAELFELRLRERTQALAALQRLSPEATAQHPHERARDVLQRLRRLEDLEGRSQQLCREDERLAELEQRQRLVRARVLELGLANAASALEVERELGEAENRMRALEELLRDAELGRERNQAEISSLNERHAELCLRAARYAEVVRVIERLGSDASSSSWNSRAEVVGARARWLLEREQLRQECGALESRRERLKSEAYALESSGGSVHPEILRLRDELDAELLSSRFEDLDLAEAAELEAALGPLSEALIVQDPAEAAKKLSEQDRDLGSVWLISPEVDPLFAEHQRLQRDVLVFEQSRALRVTRLSSRPTLGRRARERRGLELRQEIEQLSAELETTNARLSRLTSLLADADSILERGELLDLGDPAVELEAVLKAREAAQAAEEGLRQSVSPTRAEVLALRPRVVGLRSLLSEAHLLEAGDYSAERAEVRTLLLAAASAERELLRSAEDRRLLERLLDALRFEPSSDTNADQRRQRLTKLDEERDRAFRAAQALAEVQSCRYAAGFADAERLLAEREEVLPALEAQHREAREGVEQAEALLAEAEAAWEASTAEKQRAEAAYEAVAAHRARRQSELLAEGITDTSEAALLESEREAAVAEARLRELEREERTLLSALTLEQERLTQLERTAAAARAELERCRELGTPIRESEQRFSQAAKDAGVDTALGAPSTQALAARSSRELWPEAQAKAVLLCDRLSAARGSAELSQAQRQRLTESRQASAVAYLQAWLEVREWLRSRLPAQVADVADPLAALAQLREGLVLLEQRLSRQEGDLRGTSLDVARSIDVQLRRAHGQVRRLNQNLVGISFGSIAGIRVQMRRVERMDQVLSALREGSAQNLLFDSMLPIEQALDEVFRRYAGGRSGGQRILDYREYLELIVEIQRQASSDWEPASPTRLSTGEAIGVGAALMMVILTEWERDGNLLRGKRSGGSLRFLFLDEANRLSQDNLGVLFDLCKNLDLQLLIAAPEVAKAQGNTTYRLIRQVSETGREEVLVSGRRARPELTPAAIEPAREEPL